MKRRSACAYRALEQQGRSESVPSDPSPLVFGDLKKFTKLRAEHFSKHKTPAGAAISEGPTGHVEAQLKHGEATTGFGALPTSRVVHLDCPIKYAGVLKLDPISIHDQRPKVVVWPLTTVPGTCIHSLTSFPQYTLKKQAVLLRQHSFLMEFLKGVVE